MRRRCTLLRCLAMWILLGRAAIAGPNPAVEEMVAAVSKARLTSHVQILEDFQTRHTYTQGNTDAGNWIFAFFTGLGIEVERHQFTYGSHTEENIIARIPGTTHPEEIIAISGHFDSTSEQPLALAPGADDDASAIAGVLEAAVILRDYQFERTLEFMCYNAEEQGRRGSIAIATDYQAAGTNLVAVINSDMIGYWPTDWERDLDVAYEPVSEWLADHVIAVCRDYVGIPTAKHLSGACRDDHYSFTSRGYSAVTNMDCWDAHNGGGETTPHYHRTSDTIATLNLDCMTQVVQVNIASVAELAHPSSAVGIADNLPTSSVGSTLPSLTIQPNPVAPSTTLSYYVPTKGPVSLRIYSASGRLVRTLVSCDRSEGRYGTTWRGLDDLGQPVAAGVYYAALRAADAQNVTKRIVLLR